MAAAAMPGAGLVVIEPKFGFRGLKTVLNGSAMAFEADQRGDVRSGRAPGGKEGEIIVGYMAAEDHASKGRN
jgi:hypothetical protein